MLPTTTASGTAIATAYQYQATRQRISREPSRRSPARPSVIGTTMRTATRGEKAPNDPNGTNAQATAKLITKKVSRGWRRTNKLSPERWYDLAWGGFALLMLISY
jgi:hypothetical protein